MALWLTLVDQSLVGCGPLPFATKTRSGSGALYTRMLPNVHTLALFTSVGTSSGCGTPPPFIQQGLAGGLRSLSLATSSGESLIT